MSQKDKLLMRLLSRPADFSFEEAEALLRCFNYTQTNKGKTSGSRVLFYRHEDGHKILLHKPHPQNTFKAYALNDLILGLKEGGNL